MSYSTVSHGTALLSYKSGQKYIIALQVPLHSGFVDRQDFLINVKSTIVLLVNKSQNAMQPEWSFTYWSQLDFALVGPVENCCSRLLM